MSRRKRAIPHPKQEIHVRTRSVGPLAENLPYTAQLLLNGLLKDGKSRSHLSFAVNCLPPTVNNMYTHTRFSTRLTPEAKSFRDLVALAIGHQRFLFKCKGTAIALIFLESPYWLTQKSTVREMDADNRVKPTLDGVKNATGVPDETNWEVHVWKCASKIERTTVYLFDLGDVVNYHS